MFPNTKQTIEVGREKSIGALLEADKTDKKLVIVSQKDPQVENPTDKDIYGIGTLCQIVKLTKLVDGTYVAALKGIKRVKINKLILEKQDLYVDYELCKEVNVSIEQCKEKIDLLISMVEKRFTAPTKDGAKQLQAFLESSTSATKLLDTLSNLLPIDFTSKQQLLSEFNVLKRIDLLLKFCSNTNDSQIIDRDINKRINDSLSKQQKEFYLREKMRVVKEELGELNSKEDDINSLKKRVQDNPYPQHIKTRVLQELNRIESTANPQENSITRSFVE
jgi:ATP-dependent Lon protease